MALPWAAPSVVRNIVINRSSVAAGHGTAVKFNEIPHNILHNRRLDASLNNRRQDFFRVGLKFNYEHESSSTHLCQHNVISSYTYDELTNTD